MSSESKLRKMEEEMSRFEAEIASQTPQVPGMLPHTLQHSQPVVYSLPYVPGSQLAAPGLMTQNPLLATPSLPGVYMPQTYPMSMSYMTPTMPPPLTAPPVCQASFQGLQSPPHSQSTVISAPPQMTAPSELAAAARANREAEAAATMVDYDVDDDVTRALLAAAAGVTYSRPATGSASHSASSSSKQFIPPSLIPSQLSTPAIIPRVPLEPPGAPPLSSLMLKSKSSSTNTVCEAYPFQKKVYRRVAAGMVWEDPTLSEWNPCDFRMFCGDLGDEVSDSTLVKAFSRYASFQKAKVVVDKRTGKSRGYGFVSFSDPTDFTRAMREMNGKYVGNRPIKLKKSDWKNRQLESFRKREKDKKKLGLRI